VAITKIAWFPESRKSSHSRLSLVMLLAQTGAPHFHRITALQSEEADNDSGDSYFEIIPHYTSLCGERRTQ
jgi:hypothetical protein